MSVANPESMVAKLRAIDQHRASKMLLDQAADLIERQAAELAGFEAERALKRRPTRKEVARVIRPVRQISMTLKPNAADYAAADTILALFSPSPKDPQ